MIIKPGDLIVKDPDADEAYAVDWERYLRALDVFRDGQGTTYITGSTWEVDGPDAALASSHLGVVLDAAAVGPVMGRARWGSGTRGLKYRVTNRIVTNNVPPVRDAVSFFIKVQEE